MVKSLAAPYAHGRTRVPRLRGACLKWKRDHSAFGWDADCLVVGGFRGTEGSSGGLTRFIVALRLPDEPAGKLFATFARAFTGLTVRCCEVGRLCSAQIATASLAVQDGHVECR